MPSSKRPALRIGWRMSSSEKWGHEVVLFDPLDADSALFWILPDDGKPFSWPTEAEAREAAVAALRELADRIERGEE